MEIDALLFLACVSEDSRKVFGMDQRTVTVYRNDKTTYARCAPFHPAVNYPEYRLGAIASESNVAYESVRGAFQLAKLDDKRFGTPEWNPLREHIRPGDTVLLKPNLLAAHHPRDSEGWQYVITHGSIVRAVADYVWMALEGSGKIIVADAPLPETSFTEVCGVLGLDRIADFYNTKNVLFELLDLRRTERTMKDEVVVSRRDLPGDTRGYVRFDLGGASEFVEHGGAGKYYGADYDSEEVNSHHRNGLHEYELSGTAIDCDVFFNLPKLKTHKKVGVTINLKNLVGVNGNKNFLPHHTDGDPSNGGDQFPQPGLKSSSERQLVYAMRRLSTSVPVVGPLLHRYARKAGKKVYGTEHTTIRSGNWYGNDTTWRMCLDLNKIVLYGNMDGTFRDSSHTKRKRYLSIVDGIIAGEGSGPSDPDPVRAGIVAFGTNAAAIDATCAYLMGFDPEQIAVVRQAFRCQKYPIIRADDWRETICVSNEQHWNGNLPEIAHDSTLRFKPHYGWLNQIERTVTQSHAAELLHA